MPNAIVRRPWILVVAAFLMLIVMWVYAIYKAGEVGMQPIPLEQGPVKNEH